MPQPQDRLQIAQGDNGHSTGQGHTAEPGQHAGEQTHATTEHGGKEHGHKIGEVPPAGLLFTNGIVVALIMLAFGIAATRKLAAVPRGVLQNFGEFLVETFVNFTRGVIGPGGEKYAPLAGTLFFFIYLSNVIGLVPGFHAPTANISTTLALGLIVFVYVQYVGIRSRGIVGYIKHYMGPMPALAPLIMPVEIIGELVRPFTLAMRLFGNIFGEDTVIIVLAALGVMLLPAFPVIPPQFPIMVIAMITTFVQALVFTLLTCIYISLQTHHDDDHAEHAHGAEHAPAHGH